MKTCHWWVVRWKCSCFIIRQTSDSNSLSGSVLIYHSSPGSQIDIFPRFIARVPFNYKLCFITFPSTHIFCLISVEAGCCCCKILCVNYRKSRLLKEVAWMLANRVFGYSDNRSRSLGSDGRYLWQHVSYCVWTAKSLKSLCDGNAYCWMNYSIAVRCEVYFVSWNRGL